MITRDEARTLLSSMTKSASLLRHMRTVELVMEAYAIHFKENPDEWAVAGLLHGFCGFLRCLGGLAVVFLRLRVTGALGSFFHLLGGFAE